ncbi:MAG: 8-oxoguanine DNA glycosylase [Clostridia bacterium]|nr:8-oxoguanine DNA glycosylase [Clostridia bacterium]
MKILQFPSKYFNIKDTLECGQIFRFRPFKKGYFVISGGHACYVFEENSTTFLHVENGDEEGYFLNFFDIKRDYESIVLTLEKSQEEIIKTSVNLGKGIRILKQDLAETLFSFIISQNNNIPRIKSTIEKLCFSFGEEKEFMGEKYFAFPNYNAISNLNISTLKSFGLGYRAEYVLNLAILLKNGLDLNQLKTLSDCDLKAELLKIKGVGPKVADCVMLFAFSRTGSFPVDTWLKKVYIENFNGNETNTVKISKYFTDRFSQNSGFLQQYLFNYKRNLEKSLK